MKPSFLIKLLVLAGCLWVSCALQAQVAYTKHFNESEYHYDTQADGKVAIRSTDFHVSYGTPEQPALPLTTLSYLLPYGYQASSITISHSPKKLVKENLPLATNPISIDMSNGQIAYEQPPHNAKYIGDNQSPYMTFSQWYGLPVCQISLTPYSYEDANLYFIEDFTITITLEESGIHNEIFGDLSILRRELQSLVNNPEDIDPILSQVPLKCDLPSFSCDYLIITSKELAESFNPLVEWKNKKGVITQLITIEDIVKAYPGADTQAKIKQCILDYATKGTFYILLGGDDSVIPARYCQTQSWKTNNKYVYPTDLYYASIEDDAKWDSNGDGYYGTNDDAMEANCDLALTRLPIRTPEEVNNYLTKLIAYERGYNSDNWNLSLLMAGSKLYVDNSENISQIGRLKSDAEFHADMIFDSYIQPYWSGKRLKLFDTYTDFEGGADYAFHPDNLNEQLAESPMFLSVLTHGNFECWQTEDGHYVEDGKDKYREEYLYDRTNAGNLIGKNYTLVTTIACDTNMFDEEAAQIAPNPTDPCLSESLIRGKDNGIIGYLGCSRVGYTTASLEGWGESETYEGKFYATLLTEPEKNFGRIVARSKNANKILQNKRTMFPMNPMGDAEMPIYTEIPKLFKDICIYGGPQNLVVETGTEDALITLTDKKSGRLITRECGNLSLCPPQEGILSVTKQNYKPLIYHFYCSDNIIDFYQEIPLKEGYKEILVAQIYDDMYMILDNTPTPDPLRIKHISQQNDGLKIILGGQCTDYSGYTLTISNILDADSSIHQLYGSVQEIAISHLPKGFYSVTLSRNGTKIDSEKIYIK